MEEKMVLTIATMGAVKYIWTTVPATSHLKEAAAATTTPVALTWPRLQGEGLPWDWKKMRWGEAEESLIPMDIQLPHNRDGKARHLQRTQSRRLEEIRLIQLTYRQAAAV